MLDAGKRTTRVPDVLAVSEACVAWEMAEIVQN
jgi:hypothetical protein